MTDAAHSGLLPGRFSPRSLFEAALMARFGPDPVSDLADRFAGVFSSRGSPLDRLQWVRGFYHPDYLRLQSLADWWSVHRATKAFAGALMHKARKLGVPLYVSRAHVADDLLFRTGFAVRVAHCRYGEFLSRDEWVFLDWLARGVPLDRSLRLCCRPGGVFVLDGLPWVPDVYPHQPVRLTPNKLLSISKQ